MESNTVYQSMPVGPAGAALCALAVAFTVALAWPVGEPQAVTATVPSAAAQLTGITASFPTPDRAYLTSDVLRSLNDGVTLPELPNLPGDSWRHRLVRQLGVIPKRWTSPGRLLATGRAASDGELPEHLSRQGHRLQNELIAALLTASSREALRASGGLIRQLDLSYNTGYGGSPDSAGIDAVLALIDDPRHAVYSQLGYLMQDEEHSLSTGIGYRVLSDGAKAMLGANAFYDYLSAPSTHRLSIGLEARLSLLDIYFNWYERLSSPEANADGSFSYSPSGWDLAVAGRIPWVPWLSLNVERYRWNRLFGESDLRGLTYSAVLTPIPLTELSLNYDNSVGEGADLALEGRIRYRFGVPLSRQIQPLRASTFAGRVVPNSRRFERAQREYRHWVQTFTPCQYTLGFVGDSAAVDEGTSIVLTLRATRNRADCDDALSIAEPPTVETLTFAPALASVDLSFVSGALTLEREVRITAVFDSDAQPDLAIDLQLLANGTPVGAALELQVNDLGVGTESGIVQLGPVEVVRRFTLTTVPERITEDATATDVVVTATLDGSVALARDLLVRLSFTGTATRGTDYTLTGTESITISTGSLSGTTTLALTSTDDTNVEIDELIVLTGMAGSMTIDGTPITFPTTTAEFTLVDNDTAGPTDIRLSVSPTTFNEGDLSPTMFSISATLGSGTASTDIDITLSVDSSSTASTSDYFPVSFPVIQIPMGQASSGEFTFDLSPVTDTSVEGPETVVITGTATNFTVVPPLPTITLIDDEVPAPPPPLSIGRTQTITLRETIDSGLSFSLGSGCTSPVDFRLRAGGGASLGGSASDITLSIGGTLVSITASAEEYTGTLPCNQVFLLSIVDDDFLEEGESLNLELGDAMTSFFPSAQYTINLVDPNGRIIIERIADAGASRESVTIGSIGFADGLSLPEDGSAQARYRLSAALEGASAATLASFPLVVFIQGTGTSAIDGQPDFRVQPSNLNLPAGWSIEERLPGNVRLTRYEIPLEVNGPAREIVITGVADNLAQEDREGVLIYVPRSTFFGGGDFSFNIDEAFSPANDGLGFNQPQGFNMPVPALIDAISIADEGVLSTTYEQRLDVFWDDRGNDQFSLYVAEANAPGTDASPIDICLEMTGAIVGSIRPPLPDVSVRLVIDQRTGAGEATLDEDYTLSYQGGRLSTSTTIQIGGAGDFVERNNSAGVTSSVFNAPGEDICVELAVISDAIPEGYERIRLRLSSSQPAGGVNLINAVPDPDVGPGSARSSTLNVYIGDLPEISIVQMDGSARRIDNLDQDPLELSVANANAESMWFLIDPPATRNITVRLLGQTIPSATAPDFAANSDITVSTGTLGTTAAQDDTGILYATPNPTVFSVDRLIGSGTDAAFVSVTVPTGTGLFSITLQATTNVGREGNVVIDPQLQNRASGYRVRQDPPAIHDRQRVRIVP